MTTVKVLTANLWLLPPPASLDNYKRLEEFIKIAKKVRADVINLQEVWLKQYIKYLKDKLSEYHLVTPSSIFYNKSGLVTLLLYKPANSKFYQFEITRDYSPVEKVASKGVLRSQFLKNNKLFTIINTQIYESIEKSKIMIKIDQLKKVIHHAKKHNPTIIAGDLNMKPRNITKYLKEFIGVDIIPNTYSGKNKYTHEMANFLLNKDGVRNSYPNRVLLNIKSKKAHIKVEVIEEPLVSDHYPLLAEVQVV